MKRSVTAAIARIDRAIKRVYNLETPHRAEHFLIANPLSVARVANSGMGGALYLRPGDQPSDLDLGIYLSESVCEALAGFARWNKREWTFAQVSAFTVAAEEISHFHYLLHHLETGRGVSQLELELQGEVDKFVLAYFARQRGGEEPSEIFEGLFEQIFERFRWADTLSAAERSRYEAANRFARAFLRKCAADFGDRTRLARAFATLRRFYQNTLAEKISLATA